jgi:CheY-like chemotaxis protein
MAQRVFVQVSGFSAAERHALNTVFRLSEDRDTTYALWTPAAPEAPKLLVVDGESPDAQAQLQAAEGKNIELIWVGPTPPPHCWRVFGRPISWHEVIEAIDLRFAPAGPPDLDLGFGDDAQDTQPPEPEEPQPRALIVSRDREQRLYLRARLALAGLACVDEAESGWHALELANASPYCVALVAHGPPEVDGWAVLKQLHATPLVKPFVILTKDECGIVDRLLARLRGADAFLCNRPDPGILQGLLEKIAAAHKQPDIQLALP